MSEAVNSRGFVHLRVRSAYSLLEGAIKAGKVPTLAADAGMPPSAARIGTLPALIAPSSSE